LCLLVTLGTRRPACVLVLWLRGLETPDYYYAAARKG
jgi:hypothetical protein